MSWRLSMATVLCGVAAVISGGIALYSWRHREKRMALQFAVLQVGIVAWALSYAVQIGYRGLAEQLFWQRITLGVSAFIPAVFLLFTFAYTNREAWLSRSRVALLMVEPFVWFLLCLTNPVHELVWTDAVLTATALGPVPALDFGIGYIVHISYAYSSIIIGLGLLLLHATKIALAYQRQVELIVLAAIPAFLSNVLFALGFSPVPNFDLTPFAFVVTGLLLAFALFEFNLLQLVPIARQQAFHETGDGLLIVNNEGR